VLSLEQLMKFARVNATPPDQLEAFQRGMDALRRTHPDRWVVYTAVWDETVRTFEFVVHGVFESQKDAVDSTLALSPKERGMRTLTSTRNPPAGYRI
jgi:hypothetical protein